MRTSWLSVWVGLGLALCLAGCQGLFPKPVYTPPPAAPPAQAPPPVPQVARPLLYVAVNRLNLRACPGMDCPKIAVLDRNAEVEKVGDAEDWSQIRVKRDGTIGWVSSRYLSATPVAAPPEVAPAPSPPETVTPPPLPERPEKAKPAPEKVPAVEKPKPAPEKVPAVEKPKPAPEKVPAVEKPKPAKPGEVPPPAIKKKPEEALPAKPAKPGKPAEEPAPEKPEKPEKVVKPEKPAKPAPPEEKPAPPAEPEKPGKIRIM